jgi:hypothetical protein
MLVELRCSPPLQNYLQFRSQASPVKRVETDRHVRAKIPLDAAEHKRYLMTARVNRLIWAEAAEHAVPRDGGAGGLDGEVPGLRRLHAGPVRRCLSGHAVRQAHAQRSLRRLEGTGLRSGRRPPLRLAAHLPTPPEHPPARPSGPTVRDEFQNLLRELAGRASSVAGNRPRVCRWPLKWRRQRGEKIAHAVVVASEQAFGGWKAPATIPWMGDLQI